MESSSEMTMKSTCPCSEQESRGVLTRTRHVEAGETVDLPAVAGTAGAGGSDRGSGDVEVAPGLQDEAVDAADIAADIVDVGGGLEADVAAGDAAAVDEIAGGVEVKGVARNQGAVGQGDGLLDEPDDVAGELGDLFADELLFVEAVAEAFEGGGGVVAEGR